MVVRRPSWIGILLFLLGLALVLAPRIPMPRTDLSPNLAHPGLCPKDTRPVTHDWLGGERNFSCARCDGIWPFDACAPHGPTSQWWGNPPILLWEGDFDNGRRVGEWRFHTYGGIEYLRLEFDDGFPSGAPRVACGAGWAPHSDHYWPGGQGHARP